MPNRGERRHEQLVRYYRGEFDRIYKKTVLKGPHGVKVETISYLALYAEGDMSYLRIQPVAVQKREAQQQALGLTLPAQPISPQARIAGTRQGRRSLVNLDDLNWNLATEETEKHDLPAIFVVWALTTYGGHEQVALWCPEMVPSDWALARFKQGIRNCLARG